MGFHVIQSFYETGRQVFFSNAGQFLHISISKVKTVTASRDLAVVGVVVGGGGVVGQQADSVAQPVECILNPSDFYPAGEFEQNPGGFLSL